MCVREQSRERLLEQKSRSKVMFNISLCSRPTSAVSSSVSAESAAATGETMMFGLVWFGDYNSFPATSRTCWRGSILPETYLTLAQIPASCPLFSQRLHSWLLSTPPLPLFRLIFITGYNAVLSDYLCDFSMVHGCRVCS